MFTRHRVLKLLTAQLLLLAVALMLSASFASTAVAMSRPPHMLSVGGETQRVDHSGTAHNVRERLTADLMKIGLALQTYHDVHGTFPPAYVADANGRPLFSWRVLLLPYLGEQALFDQFDTSKPWYDRTNLAVLQQMPEVFRGPLASHRSIFTHYAGVAGPGTFFDCVQARTDGTACAGTRLAAITDGTSNTVAVGEVARARIPWTMPEDVDIRTHPTLGARGGFSGVLKDGVPFVFADGSVQFLPTSTPADVLHAFFTINGGEVGVR
jgi:type IV secretory pathway VirB2 component (pilin)